MKRILLIILFPIFCYCQNSGYELLKKINGVEVYYKKTLKKSTDKKDIWIVEVEYTNVTDHDIYYKTLIKQKEKWQQKRGDTEPIIYKDFAAITTENTKGFFNGSTSGLTGDKTRLNTDAGENIYLIKKGKTYILNSIEFVTEKTVTPIISLNLMNSISFTDSIYDFL